MKDNSSCLKDYGGNLLLTALSKTDNSGSTIFTSGDRIYILVQSNTTFYCVITIKI